PHCLECAALKLEIHPEDFEVDEMHRFEGMSSTDDNSILYAISSKDGIKGTLVDAYGVYAQNISEEMRKKLR
ncbi:MAG: phosphoribosylpyrophosphate synthetase, partial [Pricia sp.]|nr:phosphoribosylpyrophosphate synthetase [Pricia sp.]